MPRSTRQIAARILVTAVNQCMIATGNHLIWIRCAEHHPRGKRRAP